MGIYKPTYTQKGKLKESPNWHALFTDHTGARRRMPGYSDKESSKTMLERLQSLAATVAVKNHIKPELAEWIDGLDAMRLGKLVEWGMVDERASQATRPVVEHIAEWQDSLLDAGKTVNHANLVKARVEKLFTGCGFVRYSDINEAKVGKYLATMRAKKQGGDGTTAKGASIRTANFYLKSAQQFCRWMVRNKRAMELPLSGSQPLDAELDRRLVRRALTIAELGRLLKAAETGVRFARTCGVERSLIYRLATETGLRRNEIRSLTKKSFGLDTDEPTVTVDVTNSKRRKEDTLPLQDDTAAMLRLHLATKLDGARAFAMNAFTAQMLRQDLAVAGIEATTDEGVVDFHSLRVTFITNLARGGVHPKQAQMLARHSTSELTMQVYTKLNKSELRPALAALPRFAAGA